MSSNQSELLSVSEDNSTYGAAVANKQCDDAISDQKFQPRTAVDGIDNKLFQNASDGQKFQPVNYAACNKETNVASSHSGNDHSQSMFDKYMFEKWKAVPNVLKYIGSGRLFFHEPERNNKSQVQRGKTVYKCRLCPRVFNDNRSLLLHIPLHRGTMPLRCGICSKAYLRRSNVRNHLIYTHYVARKQVEQFIEYIGSETGERRKPWFTRNSHLGKGSTSNEQDISIEQLRDNPNTDVAEFDGYFLKINYFTKFDPEVPKKCYVSKKITFVCKYCFIETDQRMKLMTHIRSHQGPYKCVLCGAPIKSASDIMNHLKEIHCIRKYNMNDYIDKSIVYDIDSSDSGVNTGASHFSWSIGDLGCVSKQNRTTPTAFESGSKDFHITIGNTAVGDHDSSMMETELQTDHCDSAMIKTELQTDHCDSVMIETEHQTDHCNSAMIKTELQTDHCDSAMIKTELETDHCDSAMIKTELQTDHCDSAMIKTELKTDHCDSAKIKTELQTDDCETSDSHSRSSDTTANTDT